MRALKLSHFAFAGGLVGLGVLSLVYDDFALEWQPLPPGFPWRHGLAYASGAVLLAGAIGLLVKPVAVRCALALSGYHLVWVLAQGVHMIPHPREVVGWLTLGQVLLPPIGAWLLAGSLNGADDTSRLQVLRNERILRIAQMVFGLSCVFFGLSHFKYTQASIDVIPWWLPAKRGIAYLTGAAHIAAGLGVLTGILSRLAATLEALMLASFVLLVHLPSVLASPAPSWAPNAQVQWTEVFIVLVMTASAGLVAHSMREKPWGFGTARASLVR
jgi:uncharacterized membrane protein